MKQVDKDEKVAAIVAGRPHAELFQDGDILSCEECLYVLIQNAGRHVSPTYPNYLARLGRVPARKFGDSRQWEYPYSAIKNMVIDPANRGKKPQDNPASARALYHREYKRRKRAEQAAKQEKPV